MLGVGHASSIPALRAPVRQITLSSPLHAEETEALRGSRPPEVTAESGRDSHPPTGLQALHRRQGFIPAAGSFAESRHPWPQEPSAGAVLCGKKSFLVKKDEENAGGKEHRFWSDPDSV